MEISVGKGPDFKMSRGKEILYQYEFHIDGGAYVRYVHPSQMADRAKYFLTTFNHKSPMALKLEELESRSSRDWHLGDNMEDLAAKLADFRKKYPEIFLPNAKKSKAA